MLTLTRPLAFIDPESTGIDVVQDRIIEFGVTVLMPDLTRTRWEQRFNPGIPISPEATAVHGITDEDVKDCPPFEEHARGILKGLKDRDIAGYNLWRLDLPLLDEELRRCGFRLDLTGVQVVDSFGIFQKKQPRKLEDAVRTYCGREHEGAHGAGADADATADVLLGQLAAHADLGEMDLAALATFSMHTDQRPVDIAGKLYRDPAGFLCYAFGKHKGKRVVDESGYAFWMLNKAQFPGSTCEALEIELNREDAA